MEHPLEKHFLGDENKRDEVYKIYLYNMRTFERIHIHNYIIIIVVVVIIIIWYYADWQSRGPE